METKEHYAVSKYTTQYVPVEVAVLQEQFKYAMDIYTDSLREADVINSFVEGNHYSFQTLMELKQARRSPEAYNLILRIKRLLVGYFKKVVTTAVAEAVTIGDTETANLHNEHFKLAQRLSNWDYTMSEITSDLIMTGQGVWGIEVTATGRFDELGRSINDISFKHIPSRQVLIDPRCRKPDNSDAKYVHFWEFVTRDELELEFGKAIVDKLDVSHYADGELVEAETASSGMYDLYLGVDQFQNWKDGQSFFIVRSWQRDINTGKITEYVWHGDLLLRKTLLPTQLMPVMGIHLQKKLDNRRYYSPMYEACASQDSINQALLQFQKLVGEKRIFTSNKSIDKNDVPELERKLKTIGAVLHLRNIEGLLISDLNAEAMSHLNKMYTSIQLIMQVIGINEAFLGESKAGDSGRKFEGQRSAAENTLDYIFTPLNLIYETMLLQCIHYSSVYKQATEYLRFTDEFGRSRWQQVNLPFAMPTGELHPDGVPVVDFISKEVYNEATQQWELAYVNEKSKSLSDIAVEVSVHSAPYDDSDATELAFIEGMLNGVGGQIIASADPAGVPFLYSLLTANLKTRNSEEVSAYLTALSQKLGGLPVHDPRLYAGNKSFGASGGGGTGNAVTQGAGAQGSQGTMNNNIGNQGAISYAGGTTNDNQPAGYNQPKNSSEGK